MSPVRALLLHVLLLTPLPALAEAGLPFSFCGEASCACGAATCTCGQVCNFNQQTCMSPQAGFCTSDEGCAASCNNFICEGNTCVPGMRTDGGVSSGSDAGPIPTPTPPASGCDATGAAPALLLFALALRRR